MTELITLLLEAKEERQLLRLRQQLGKLDLLILDELGYVPASKAGAELLFDVIATAYERNSLIVTTNLPFEKLDGGAWAASGSQERPSTGSRTAATSWRPRARATACRTLNAADAARDNHPDDLVHPATATPDP